MSPATSVRYRINDKDEIVFVDEGWQRFAADNDGADLVAGRVLGRVLWNYISDETTCRLYQRIVERARQGNGARFTLRCDSPACRRRLEMSIQADEQGNVEFETRLLRSETREPLFLLARATARSAGMIRVCAWCSRIDVGSGTWLEAEEAIARLDLFELADLPQLTHGVCDECYDFMDAGLARQEADS